MKKTDLFRNRPMPPAVEVVQRHGTLDRLIKCPKPDCRGRHYESLMGPGDVCLNCGTLYVLPELEPAEAHLYRMYGGRNYLRS